MFTTDLYTDIKWLKGISYKLDRFKKSSPSSEVYNARCPYCGDSDSSSKKSRLYFYTKKGSMNFDCKNCGEHGSFYKFMKEQCPNEFEEYKRDQLKETMNTWSTRTHKPSVSKPTQVPEPVNETPDKPLKTLSGTVPILDLPKDHQALIYLTGRGFREEQLKRLLYSENFKSTCDSISPEPMKDTFPTEGRIVIPFYDKEGNVEVIQGRSLRKKTSLRYITIKASEEVDKIYGKYELDEKKTRYCVEGPLDSLFVDNCLATCDSNLLKADADVYIWDCQPRNKEIIELMEEAIDKGKKVVVWPESPNKKLDINDMVQMGLSKQELMKIIEKRTFKGLTAKLELTKWRKI